MRKVTKKEKMKMSPISSANIPPHIYQQLMQGIWSPSPASLVFSEDMEANDIQAIQAEIEKYMLKEYPEFEPEIIYTPDKEYYLPALKVLLYDGKRYFSPSYREQWVDGELRASCQERNRISFRWDVDGPPERHQEVPDEECDCGIYGSVNLEEIRYYLYSEYEPIKKFDTSPLLTIDFNNLDQVETYTYPSIQKMEEIHLHPTLCIIEPMPDAKVILCRKGWKASHAFISEIVRETISVGNASQLLSIAWKRNIDLRRLYNENR